MAKKNNNISKVIEIKPNEIGKLPPQALDIEEVVLGALMLEKGAFSYVSELLTPESFYKIEHQKIFFAIFQLSIEDHPVDMLTVAEELKKHNALDEIGGPVYLANLTHRVSAATHIEYHAKIIAQKFLQRELIRVSSEILNESYEDGIDIEDLLGKAEGSIFELSQRRSKKEAVRVDSLVAESMSNIREAAKRKDGLSGIASGFHELDKMTSGWQRSDLVIIAARPAMGKTAFVLSMARQMAMMGNGVGVFSLEMSNMQLVNRIIVGESEIKGDKIKNGNLTAEEWDILDNKIKNLIDVPLYVDDTPSLSIFELRSKVRRLVSQNDIKVIAIDYLQLMTASGMGAGSREQEVSLISRSLKALAREVNIPILALSQLNRGVEGRQGTEGKKPQLSDLRESGAIEQDADMVMFIHRPEYYKILEDSEGRDTHGIAEIIISKHRNGSVGEVRLKFRGELTRFENIASSAWDKSNNNLGKEVTFQSKMNDDVQEFPIGNLDADLSDDDPFGIRDMPTNHEF